ncbi:pyridoxal phosphate-dependent transferase [Microdochium bolleyi]|uniref:histidinol-phosphate transaminase n=1 Tax=Microdochium bolleyi TaxID=196109 RepID=A0A136IT73_9PEZI|nr:pyridoxal phosphate-dependent transferase [Microdochium bolleyi]
MPQPFDVRKCARPNVIDLPLYTTPRCQYPDNEAMTLLDANENPFGPSITKDDAASGCNGDLGAQTLKMNRYPDLNQTKLKQMFCEFRNDDQCSTQLGAENVTLCVGADEAIDVVIRAFCTPGRDKILITPPTYGIYHTFASINDNKVVQVHLDADDNFALRAKDIKTALAQDPCIKVVFLCSPGNPAGNLLPATDITDILDLSGWNGIVVVDEAYVDFAPPGTSFAPKVTHWPNLVVIQTLSKAFGLAGIRLGAIFAQPEISRVLNNVKNPFNLSASTIALAKNALQPAGISLMEGNVKKMAEQSERLRKGLAEMPAVDRILGGEHTSFVLVRFLDKPEDLGGVPDNSVAQYLANHMETRSQILVGYRGYEHGCEGCLRIAIGSRNEVDAVLTSIREGLEELHALKVA